MTDNPLSIFSPAKINLYLHVTGKRADGYHDLDSLVAFTNFGDRMELRRSSTQHKTTITGPFADALTNTTTEENNLAIRAIRELEKETGCEIPLDIRIEKNIPLGGGLGGGSSNAACLLKTLIAERFPELDKAESYALAHSITSRLGSDLTAFLHAPAPVILQETGNRIKEPDIHLPECNILLVNAGQHSATPAIFKALRMERFSAPCPNIPARFQTAQDLCAFLKNNTKNDLTGTAIRQTPIIAETLDLVAAQEGCLLARMTGSGATCFGIFGSDNMSSNAREKIKEKKPDWWAVSTKLMEI